MKIAHLTLLAGLLFGIGAEYVVYGQTVPFTDVSSASGISIPVNAMSWPFDVAAGDFDCDGFLDLYIISHDAGNGAPHVFLHNNGNGTFSHPATDLDTLRMPYTAMICDMNNDGMDDFVPSDGDVCSYYGINKGDNKFTAAKAFCTNGHGNAAGDYDMDGDVDFFFNSPGNGMFRNNGDGTYTNVFSSLGIAPGNGICSFFADLNNDDAPELFRTADTGAYGLTPVYTRPLMNDGQGHLVETNVGLDSCPGVGVALGDIDNDGDLDVFGAGYGCGTTDSFYYKLYRNDGGQFTDMTAASGLPTTVVSANMWLTLYYRALMTDFDNDGYLDVYCPTPEGNRLFRNLHNNTFKDVTDNAGVGRVAERNSSPFAFDYDNDGDMDLFALGSTTDTKLFRNNQNNRNWLKVRVHGNAKRTVLGAKVRVYDHDHLGEAEFLKGYREVMASSGHKSPLELHFGLDSARSYDVQVTYPPLASSPGRLTAQRLDVATAQILDFYADSGAVSVQKGNNLHSDMLICTVPHPLKKAITFQCCAIGKGTITEIRIYDPRGKLIANLKPDHRTSTTVSYTWNADNHSPGVYLARMQLCDKVHAQRLMIMK
jgi:enediyne biosynthesis protein E4